MPKPFQVLVQALALVIVAVGFFAMGYTKGTNDTRDRIQPTVRQILDQLGNAEYERSVLGQKMEQVEKACAVRPAPPRPRATLAQVRADWGITGRLVCTVVHP